MTRRGDNPYLSVAEREDLPILDDLVDAPDSPSVASDDLTASS